jgi:hypothetical protein
MKVSILSNQYLQRYQIKIISTFLSLIQILSGKQHLKFCVHN